MNIADIAKILDDEILSCKERLDLKFEYAFASDLMSDVLTTHADGMLLLTGLSNLQTIRTAEMSDVQGIVVVRGKEVAPDMIELAEENDIVLFSSKNSLYKVSGILYEKGLKPLF